ncbi:uncharacterized protein LOC126900766 [Daktulosphaira vitifoliae]|uniref:uncharacterized protein LOC126900766 n=1 Tax=Daktulosphaira vitifoliae TaxID=58002 RepID=UPI0021AA68D5|nr:uncharacterized protein LOC126900766 [Daktulosphaira vitifoliae]
MMTSSKYCIKSRNRMKLSNSKVESDHDHDVFLSKLTTVIGRENLNIFPLNTSLGRLPLSELAKEIKTGNLISKFEEFDYYTDSEDESPYVYTCSFVLAIMYFERLKLSNPAYLNSINSSELFLISLLVASKYLHDDGELDSAINSEWAIAYGISLKEINQMEKEYLSAMNWQFYISKEEFSKRYKKIIYELYGDEKQTNSLIFKIFVLISKVIRSIRKLYRKQIVYQKMRQMIAMSTVITIVTATAMQLKRDSMNLDLIKELHKEIETDPNYPVIPSISTNLTPSIKNIEDIPLNRLPSKLTALLNHLMLMNICLSTTQLSSSENGLKSYQNNYTSNFLPPIIHVKISKKLNGII